MALPDRTSSSGRRIGFLAGSTKTSRSSHGSIIIDDDSDVNLKQKDNVSISTLEKLSTVSHSPSTTGDTIVTKPKSNPATVAVTRLPLQSRVGPLHNLEQLPKARPRMLTNIDMAEGLNKMKLEAGKVLQGEVAPTDSLTSQLFAEGFPKTTPPHTMAADDGLLEVSMKYTFAVNPKKRSAETSLRSGKPKRVVDFPTVIDLDDDDSEQQKKLGTRSINVHLLNLPTTRKPTEDELRQTVDEILDNEDEMIDENTQRRTITKKILKKSSKDFVVVDLDENEDFLYQEELLLEQELRLEADRRMEAHRQAEIECQNHPGSAWMLARNPHVRLPWKSIPSTGENNFIIKPGTSVELPDHAFLRITMILQHSTNGETRLRGHRIQRTKDLNGILYKKLNELCWVIDVDLDDKRPGLEQAVEEVSKDNVVRIREVRTTNQRFPEGSFRDSGRYSDILEVQEAGPCTVRWRYTCKFLNAAERFNNKWTERSVEHLHQKDVSGQHWNSQNLTDEAVRFRFRGNTNPGGDYGANQSIQSGTGKRKDHNVKKRLSTLSISSKDEILFREAAITLARTPLPARRGSLGSNLESPHHTDLTMEHGNMESKFDGQPLVNATDEGVSQMGTPPSPKIIVIDNPIHTLPLSEGRVNPSAPSATAPELKFLKLGQTYTYGDGFCGAGGTTRGAVMAGLKPIWGFDGDKHACTSWKLNFPEAALYEMMADQFILRARGTSEMKVDILHLSPPCQFFSPAHTVPGMNDEMNSASLFASGHILDVALPRIVTLEQTFGIVLLPRFQAYFNALILMFTDRGFSLRWKIAQLQDWGLPQRRRRLIIIASCPGEILPEFPPYTHCNPKVPVYGLKPWTSVNSVLATIPQGMANHDLENAKSIHLPQWSGESIAPRCITTHGGHNYHPSGKRGLTNREFAALQGFPHKHRFSDVNIKKQIGNAVPPSIAKVLFESIKKSLEKTDRINSNHYEID